MGLDAEIFVRMPEAAYRIIAQGMDRQKAFISETCGSFVQEDILHFTHFGLSLYTYERFYGPGYERGRWPLIYNGIRVMQTVFPETTVYYAADCDDAGGVTPVTDASLSALWDHWLSPAGRAYYDR